MMALLKIWECKANMDRFLAIDNADEQNELALQMMNPSVETSETPETESMAAGSSDVVDLTKELKQMKPTAKRRLLPKPPNKFENTDAAVKYFAETMFHKKAVAQEANLKTLETVATQETLKTVEPKSKTRRSIVQQCCLIAVRLCHSVVLLHRHHVSKLSGKRRSG